MARARITVVVLAAFLIAGTQGAGAAERASNGAIAFAGKRGADRAVYVRQPNGSGLRVVPVGGGVDDPTFSPRGLRLAFTRRSPLGAQIFVSYIDGKGFRQLTTGPTDFMPAFSPSGTEVAFARGPAGARDLYRVGTDGLGLARVTTSRRSDESPAWSVGDTIAFVRRNPRNDDVYVVGARGGPARRITRSKLADRHPAWSPTGRTLVFSRGRAGKRDLYLIRSDGSGLRRLTAVPGEETEPSFSPDGTRVVFTHIRAGKRRIYLVKTKGDPVERLPSRSRRVRRITTSRSASRLPSWQPAGLDPIVAAAGDIACDPTSPYFNGGVGVPGLCRQRLTSDLLLRMDLSSVLVLGDLQYENGKLEAFRASFDPSWGRAKHLLRPVPGNHEFNDPDAAGYFDYFNGPGVVSGQAGSRGAGWYSFDVGAWHVIALNSECEFVGGCGEGSAQMQFLRADLTANPRRCTLAYFHGPRFSSGRYPDHAEDVKPFWDVLHAAGADLILSGHEHLYERFAPQTPDGVADPAGGIRQITMGLGGKSRHGFVTVAPNSEVRNNRAIGVLTLTLREATYDWNLVRAPRGNSGDSGTGACH